MPSCALEAHVEIHYIETQTNGEPKGKTYINSHFHLTCLYVHIRLCLQAGFPPEIYDSAQVSVVNGCVWLIYFNIY